jgi:hypothetical protein
MKTMSRAERYFWNALLLASPFLVRLAVVAAYGSWVARRIDVLLSAWLVFVLLHLPSGRFAWMMGHLSRLAVRPLRLWGNRRWRWYLSIDREPVTIGSQRIWVTRHLSAPQREQVGRVAEALDVLRALAPGRVSRIDRLGITFVVATAPGAAAFIPGAKVIVIDSVLLAETPGTMAGILVHELNHALLDERGLLHSWAHERAERLALVDQAYFGLRLHRAGNRPDAHRVIEWAKAAQVKPMSFRARWRNLSEKAARSRA